MSQIGTNCSNERDVDTPENIDFCVLSLGCSKHSVLLLFICLVREGDIFGCHQTTRNQLFKRGRFGVGTN